MICCVFKHQLAYILSVLEYGLVVEHHHLTHGQSDKLDALQKRAVRIILYTPITLPYITVLGIYLRKFSFSPIVAKITKISILHNMNIRLHV